MHTSLCVCVCVRLLSPSFSLPCSRTSFSLSLLPIIFLSPPALSLSLCVYAFPFSFSISPWHSLPSLSPSSPLFPFFFGRKKWHVGMQTTREPVAHPLCPTYWIGSCDMISSFDMNQSDISTWNNFKIHVFPKEWTRVTQFPPHMDELQGRHA